MGTIFLKILTHSVCLSLSCLPPYPILKECVARLNGICGMMTGDFTELCCYCTMYSSLDSRMMDFFCHFATQLATSAAAVKLSYFFQKKENNHRHMCSLNGVFVYIQNTKTFFYLKRKSHFLTDEKFFCK